MEELNFETLCVYLAAAVRVDELSLGRRPAKAQEGPARSMRRMLTRYERLRRQAKAIVARHEAKDIDRKAKERLLKLSVICHHTGWLRRAVKTSIAAHKQALLALRRHNALLNAAKYHPREP